MSSPSPDLSGLPFVIDNTGVKRYLACRPGKPEKVADHFGANQVEHDRSKWQSRDFTHFCPPVADQDATLACVGFAACTAFTTAWRISGGDREFLFSPWWVYDNIPHFPDGTTSIGDALTCLAEKGICFESEDTGPRSQAPSAPETAQKFRTELAIPCPTFDEIATAILLGCPVAFGVDIDVEHFKALAQSGVLPDKENSTGGHAMCAVGLQQIAGSWHLLVQNSWGLSFGKDGYCFMPESYFDDRVQNWAIRAIFDGPSS